MLNSDETDCIAFDRDPDTGRCSCGHSEEAHEGDLGGCELCIVNLAEPSDAD